MNYRKLALTVAAGLLLAAPLRAQDALKAQTAAQADPGYAAYIAQRKARLEQNLSRRIGLINQRFDQEVSFRRKLKDERVAFEKKMEKEESAFLQSLTSKDPQSRLAAWSAYYLKSGQERQSFYAGLRQESSQFWQARLAQAVSGQASSGPSVAAAAPSKPQPTQ